MLINVRHAGTVSKNAQVTLLVKSIFYGTGTPVLSAWRNVQAACSVLRFADPGLIQKTGGEMNNEVNKTFNKRAFVSVATFLSGIFLPVSGTMIHSLGLEGLTMERHFWMSMHNISALLFTIFIVIHIIFNRKPLFNYIKKISGIKISKEAVYAFALIIIIVGLFSSHAFHVR